MVRYPVDTIGIRIRLVKPSADLSYQSQLLRSNQYRLRRTTIQIISFIPRHRRDSPLACRDRRRALFGDFKCDTARTGIAASEMRRGKIFDGCDRRTGTAVDSLCDCALGHGGYAGFAAAVVVDGGCWAALSLGECDGDEACENEM